MMRNFSVPINPYAGVAESEVTSNPLDFRDAFDATLSWYTTSGSSSVFTYQISNFPGEPDNILEASWSNWTFVVLGSGASGMEPPLGFRYGRILRTPSGASIRFDFNKTIR